MQCFFCVPCCMRVLVTSKRLQCLFFFKGMNAKNWSCHSVNNIIIHHLFRIWLPHGNADPYALFLHKSLIKQVLVLQKTTKRGPCPQIVSLCLSSLTPRRIASHGESQVSISTTALFLTPNGGDLSRDVRACWPQELYFLIYTLISVSVIGVAGDFEKRAL